MKTDLCCTPSGLSLLSHYGFYGLILGLLILSYPALAQQDSLQAFDKRMKQLKSAQALVLGTWAGANMLTGGALILTTEGPFYYFNAMNASWGLVNAGVAAFIYFHHNQVFTQPQTLLQQMDHQRHAEKMILLNIGLDIAFVATGAALYQHAQIANLNYPELWKGFGTSVMMQGAFLLIQDIIFYRLHIKNRQKVYPLWQRMMDRL